MTQPGPLIVVERDWKRFLDVVDFADAAPAVQGLFLSDALARLSLNRDALAARIGVSSKGLTKWLAARDSNDFRVMPRMAWKFLVEIMYQGEPSA